MCRLLAVPVAVAAMILAPLGNAEHASPASSAVTCKVVIKKAHGKKHRVRVCPKPKPGLPSAGTVVATVSLPVGVAPTGQLALPGAVWVAGHRSDSLFRIDPLSNTVVMRVRVIQGEDQPNWLAYGNGTLFSVNPGGETVTLVDLVHNSVEKIADTSSGPHDFHPQNVQPRWPVFGAGSLWFIGFGGGVTRMDPSGNVIATPLTGQTDEGLAFGAESVWGSENGEVFRLDPRTNQVAARIATSAIPSAFGAGSVWGLDSSGRDIVRIDPTNNSIAATIRLPGVASTFSYLAATDTAVWVAEGASGSHLWKIDPATNRVVGVVNLGHASTPQTGSFEPNSSTVPTATPRAPGLLFGPVVGDDGSLWVSLFDADQVLRVRPT